MTLLLHNRELLNARALNLLERIERRGGLAANTLGAEEKEVVGELRRRGFLATKIVYPGVTFYFPNDSGL